MSLISLLFTNKNEKALKYMNKKYGKRFGDEFWIFDTEYAGFTSGADKFFMHSKRFPKFVIQVDRFRGKHEDSYMEIHFYKQYQEFMQPIMEEILGECKVFYQFTMYPINLYHPDITFEEYMKAKISLKDALVVVRDDSDMLNKLKKVAEGLKELNLPHGGIRVHTAKDYDTIAKLDNLGEVGEYERSHKGKIYNPTFYSLSMDRELGIRDIHEGSSKYN